MRFASLLLASAYAVFGTVWDAQMPGAPALTRVFFFDQSDGIAVGETMVFHTIDGGESWAVDSLPITDYRECLNKIVMVDRQRGFASGGFGKIWVTTDGGLSWTPKHHLYNFHGDFVVVNSDTAFGPANNGTVHVTYDGGESWQTTNTPQASSLRGGFAVTSTHWFVCGWNHGFFETRDAGQTWDTVAVSEIGNNIFQHLHFFSADTGFTHTLHGNTLLYTFDGGVSWTEHRPLPFGAEELRFPGGDTIVAFDAGIATTVAWSYDRGASWTTPVEIAPVRLHGMFMLDGTWGYALSNGLRARYVTTDGWRNLIRQDDSTGRSLTSVTFTDSATGLLYSLQGNIRRTTNGGIEWSPAAGPGEQELYMAKTAANGTSWLIAKQDEQDQALFRSDDSGGTWEAVSALNGARLYDVQTHPDGLIAVYGMHPDVNFNQHTVWYSRDDGASWHTRAPLLVSSQVHSMTIARDSLFFVGLDSGRVARSRTDGNGWIVVNTPTAERVHHIEAVTPTFIVAGCSNGVFLRSTDAGTTWTATTLSDYNIIDITFPTSRGGFMFTHAGEMLATIDSGLTWQRKDLKAERPWLFRTGVGLTRNERFAVVSPNDIWFAAPSEALLHFTRSLSGIDVPATVSAGHPLRLTVDGHNMLGIRVRFAGGELPDEYAAVADDGTALLRSTPLQAGEYTLEVFAFDDTTLRASATVTVEANQPPVASANAPDTLIFVADRDTTIDFAPFWSDPEGDSLRIVPQNAPWVAAEGSALTFSPTAAHDGSDITITVSDIYGSSTPYGLHIRIETASSVLLNPVRVTDFAARLLETAAGITHLQLAAPHACRATIRIYTVGGRMVYTEELTLRSGILVKKLGLADALAGGIYRVQVTMGERVFSLVMNRFD